MRAFTVPGLCWTSDSFSLVMSVTRSSEQHWGQAEASESESHSMIKTMEKLFIK